MRFFVLVVLMASLAGADEPKPPTAEEQTAMIAGVRQKALDYSHGLADFLCTQSTRRYVAKAVPGAEPEWQLQDTFTIRVGYYQQSEDYRVILLNGNTVDKNISELSGHRTEGEFGSILKDVFSEENQASFTWKRWAARDGATAAVLEYRIERAHSTFQTVARRMFRTTTCKWGARGEIEVNPATGQVMMLTLHSADMPADCPAKEVQMTIQYGYRKIGEQEFLLPVHSESRVNVYGQLVRAESEFANYRKFSSDTGIKFDLPPEPPRL